MQSPWQPDHNQLLRAAAEANRRRAFPLPTVHWVLFTLFIAWSAVAGWMQISRPGTNWALGILLGLALASTLVATARRLPAQNVFAATAFILVLAGIVQTVGALTSIPFGPFQYTDDLGGRIFDKLPWAMPLVWVVAILNCRVVARLILRPWRRVRTYGFRVIGLTCLLVALFDLGLEPFATRVNHFWLWQPTNIPSTWFGAPWINFFGWAVTTLLILAFATPWLINKKPVRHPPDYHALVVMLLLNAVFAAGLVAHRLWAAVAVLLAVSTVTAALAIRNSRW